MEELNAYLKQIKCEKGSQKRENALADLEKVEINSPLVIGGMGAWTQKFSAELLDEFASNNGYGYDITTFADLLRMIRNIFNMVTKTQKRCLEHLKQRTLLQRK